MNSISGETLVMVSEKRRSALLEGAACSSASRMGAVVEGVAVAWATMVETGRPGASVVAPTPKPAAPPSPALSSAWRNAGIKGVANGMSGADVQPPTNKLAAVSTAQRNRGSGIAGLAIEGMLVMACFLGGLAKVAEGRAWRAACRG